PKVAAYPFTTLEPNLGVVALDDGATTFVMADIPGLIAGASEGKGLGHEFLRHIERTRVLVHLIDGSSLDPLEDLENINAELATFGHGLSDKPQIVVVNKMDIPAVRELWPEMQAILAEHGYEANAISGLARSGTRSLLYRVAQVLSELPEQSPALEVPVFRLEQDEEGFVIEPETDGWRVRGANIERIAGMTVWNLDEAVQRFQTMLERTGITDALREAGVEPGDTVTIGDKELEWEE
ncbi:MAG: Obg family GTPase CgtA, partial [Anaerolineae bacterium]|nr:Obg family GTPase CgtA [Anaerolineae bacterium]